MWLTTTPHVRTATPLDDWHCLIRYLQVVSLPLPQWSILICKYDGHEQNSLGSIASRSQWPNFPSSLTLCCHILCTELVAHPNWHHMQICYWLQKCKTQTLSTTIKTGPTVVAAKKENEQQRSSLRGIWSQKCGKCLTFYPAKIWQGTQVIRVILCS